MDFEFSDEQEQLRDAVRRWVDKGFGFERRHALAKAGGQTRAVLGELNELGLAGLVVPEAHGGMGFGAVEAMVVMEELGRGLVNAPYAQAALVAPTLLSYAPAALQDAWLPKIAGGEALGVLAQQERHSRYDLDKVAVKATEAGGGWKLSGTKVVVPAGDEADNPGGAAKISPRPAPRSRAAPSTSTASTARCSASSSASSSCSICVHCASSVAACRTAMPRSAWCTRCGSRWQAGSRTTSPSPGTGCTSRCTPR